MQKKINKKLEKAHNVTSTDFLKQVQTMGTQLDPTKQEDMERLWKEYYNFGTTVRKHMFDFKEDLEEAACKDGGLEAGTEGGKEAVRVKDIFQQNVNSAIANFHAATGNSIITFQNQANPSQSSKDFFESIHIILERTAGIFEEMMGSRVTYIMSDYDESHDEETNIIYKSRNMLADYQNLLSQGKEEFLMEMAHKFNMDEAKLNKKDEWYWQGQYFDDYPTTD